MLKNKPAILQFVVFIFILYHVNSEITADSASKFLSKLFGRQFRRPIVAFIERIDNTPTKSISRTNEVKKPETTGKKALRYLNDVLQSTGDESNPNVKRTNEKFSNALRSRCEVFIECEIKCVKKKKDKCKNECQDKYDHLDVCKPTKDKWLSKTNKQVYKYLKKNPPQYDKHTTMDMCSTKGPYASDECKSASNDCETSDECGHKSVKECESSDSCN